MWPAPLTVTESKPLLSTPASIPVPSITWPLRSIVMPCAPTIRPTPRQSIRSLLSAMLWVTTSEQPTLVSTGAGVTSQLQVAAGAPTLPSTSVARTWNVCVPTVRPVYVIEPAEPPTTSGLPVQAHGAKLPLSIRHWNVTLSSLATQLNVASVLTVVASGPDSIVVTGAVPPVPAPIVQVWTAGVLSTLPETSTARTSKRCSPSARPVSVSGDSHGPNASASSLHWKVMSLTLSVPLKRNTAVLLVLGSAGACRICVCGATGSTEIAGPVAHWTIQHCCGISVIGSSGPMLPWARLPPPSTLLRPLLPSLTQMPQLPLSWALLPLITWLGLGMKMP